MCVFLVVQPLDSHSWNRLLPMTMTARNRYRNRNPIHSNLMASTASSTSTRSTLVLRRRPNAGGAGALLEQEEVIPSTNTNNNSDNSLWPPWPFNLIKKPSRQKIQVSTSTTGTFDPSSIKKEGTMMETSTGAQMMARYTRQRALIGLRQLQQGSY